MPTARSVPFPALALRWGPVCAALLLAEVAAVAQGTITAADAAGNPLFTLRGAGAAFAVQGAGNRALGNIKVEKDRVKLKNERGQPAFKVKRKEDRYKLYREPTAPGSADVETGALQVEAGEFKVLDASDRELYKGKTGGSAWKVRAAGGGTWNVQVSAVGVDVFDAAGKRLLRLTGSTSPGLAVFCAAREFDVLQKATMAAAVGSLGR